MHFGGNSFLTFTLTLTLSKAFEFRKCHLKKSHGKFPVLPFLVFWNSLFFLLARNSFIFERFPFFSRSFKGSVGIRNPCFLLVVSFVKKNQGQEGQGSSSTKLGYVPRVRSNAC